MGPEIQFILGENVSRINRLFSQMANQMITGIIYFTGIVVGLVIQKFGGSVAIYLGSLAAAGKTSFIPTRKLRLTRVILNVDHSVDVTRIVLKYTLGSIKNHLLHIN